jgi:hypothetical protein
MRAHQSDVCRSQRATSRLPDAARSKDDNVKPVDIVELFRGESALTVIAQVADWKLGWAGRITCDLHLSIGALPVVANRDSLPLDVQNGDWVRARLLRRHGPPRELKLLGAIRVHPHCGQPAAWIPTAQYHRVAHMHRLLTLLSQLEPGLQAIFMGTMRDRRLERGFFSLPAASDHHCYPGGLFDQSVEAAERVFRAPHRSTRERDTATLVALLLDLGKVLDSRLAPDEPRLRAALGAHPTILPTLERALATVGQAQPDLVQAFRDLTVAPCMRHAAELMRDAVKTSWRLHDHASISHD